MTENITNELIYEVLKKIQGDLTEIKGTLADHSHQFIRVREDINGLRADGLRQERTIATVQVDVERINTRLGLIDPTH
jgi:hypothetical protein